MGARASCLLRLASCRTGFPSFDLPGRDAGECRLEARAPGNTPSITALFPRSPGIGHIGRDGFALTCAARGGESAGMGLTRIANPIYDGAFKYLLDDNRIARLFLSTMIGEEIVELTFRPTEHRTDVGQRSVTVFRIDFSARIALPDGGEKLVIIEIQKAKFAADIMRFRKYLGRQYLSKENSYTTAGGELRAMPILSIYLLGHSLEHTESPVIRVVRQYLDATGRERIDHREDFIESLTHDSIIVQIPHLKQRRQNDLECLLGIFDQSQKDPADAHTLSIREEDYPKKFHGVIRRLIKAISEPDVRETMEVEDDYLEDLEDMERMVADKDAVIADKDAVIADKEAVIADKEAVIADKEAVIADKDAALVENSAVIEKAISMLVAGGLSEKDARARLLG